MTINHNINMRTINKDDTMRSIHLAAIISSSQVVHDHYIKINTSTRQESDFDVQFVAMLTLLQIKYKGK